MHRTLIEQVHRLQDNTSKIIPTDLPLEEMIEHFIFKPNLQGLFLQDKQLKFSGIVSRMDLVRWAHLKLLGGKGRHDIPVSEFYRLADARKAVDIMNLYRTQVAVKESDTLQTAINIMLDFQLDIIPVIGNDGTILGDLTVREILYLALFNK
jgi:CBS domain-containing protein